MKRLFLAVCSGLLLCATSQASIVNGKLSGFTNDTLYIRSVPLAAYGTALQRSQSRIDTLVAQNQQFQFTREVEEPLYVEIASAQYNVAAPRNIYQPRSGRAVLILQGNETANVSLQANQGMLTYTYQGESTLNPQIAQQEQSLMPFFKQEADLIRSYYQKEITPDAAEAKMNDITNDFNKQLFSAIQSNVQHPVATYLVTMYAPIETVDSLAKTLQVKEPTLEKLLESKIKTSIAVKRELEVRKRNAGKDAEGQMAPDFTLNTPEGKPFTLSSTRGKYVILDFWGSWCSWCIKGMPALRDFYNVHKDKLEIVSVACNDRDQAWREGIKKYEMTWINVFNPHNQPAEKEVTNLYNIQGYPTKYLINPQGKIVVKVIGEDPEFFTKVTKAMEEGK